MLLYAHKYTEKEFSDHIGNLFATLLEGNETIEANKSFEIDGHRVTSDFYLPLGCKKMDLPQETVIELKNSVQYGMIDNFFQLYTPLFDNKKLNKFLFVSIQDVENQGIYRYLESIPNKIIDLIDYSSFLKKVEDANKGIGEEYDDNKKVKDVGISLLDKAKSDFRLNKYSLFLGAGLSMDAKLPSWFSLLEELLKQENGSPYKELNEANAESISSTLGNSTIITGRYVFDGYKKSIYESMKANTKLTSREIEDEIDKQIVDRMRHALYKQESYPSLLIDSVANAIKTKNPIQIITYNYDDLLENKLANDVKFHSVCNNNIPRQECVPIYHVHGMIAKENMVPSFPVLSEREYHKLYSNPENWANVVQLNALNTTTCFFIGLSMIDPNQRRLLESASSSFNKFDNYEKRNAPHYVFLRKVPLKGEASVAVNQEHWDEMENMMLY